MVRVMLTADAAARLRPKLHQASDSVDIEQVRRLLADGADINAVSATGVTALWEAARAGHVEVAELLLEAGADLNAGVNQPVIAAAEGGHRQVVQMLLKAAAHNDEARHGLVHAMGSNGCTALWHAAAWDDGAETLQQLLDAGAAVQGSVSTSRINAPASLAPLYAAATVGTPQAIRVLLAAGAEVDVVDRDGNTPLHAAIQQDNVAVIQPLLEGGASLDAADSSGLLPLHAAAACGDADAVQALLAAGAPVSSVDRKGRAPIHLAAVGDTGCPTASRNVRQPGSASAEYVAVLQQLLNAGATITVADAEGRTPLHLAAAHGCSDAVAVLLAAAGAEAGAAVSAANSNGETPLHVAATRGHSDVVAVLLAAAGAAAAAAVDSNGLTPLHAAAAHEHPQVVEQLLAAGADVHAVDKRGRSALLCVAALHDYFFQTQHRREAVARSLLRAGARLDVAPADLATQSAIAAGSGIIGAVRLLIRASDFDDRADLQAALQAWAQSSHPGCPLELHSLLQKAQAAIDAAEKAANRANRRVAAAAAGEAARQKRQRAPELLPRQRRQQRQQQEPGQQEERRQQEEQQLLPPLEQQQGQQEEQQKEQQLAIEQHPGDAGLQQPQQQQQQPPGGLNLQQQSAAVAGAAEQQVQDAAAIMRLIKQEPLHVGGTEAAAGSTTQPGLPGPAAVALLREAGAAGFPLPAQQQMQYFLLADQAFDAGELLQLYGTHLACSFTTAKSVGRANRSGAIREAVVGNKVQQSRMEHQRPQLAPGFLLLRDAVPQLAGGPLELLPPQQQQQQQQQAPAGGRRKKQKVTDPAQAAAAFAAAAAAAGLAETPATARLLLALRSYELWLVRCTQEQQLPALLQLLLFGCPQQPTEAVVEVVDLVAAEEDELLQQQLQQEGFEDVVMTREVVPKQQQRHHAGGSSSGDGGGSMGAGSETGGRVKVEREA